MYLTCLGLRKTFLEQDVLMGGKALTAGSTTRLAEWLQGMKHLNDILDDQSGPVHHWL